MKKFIALSFVVGMMSASAFAVEGGRPGVSHGARGQAMKALRSNKGGALKGQDRANYAKDPANRPTPVGKPATE